MKSLFIIGAGGFGREVCRWAADHPDCGVHWRIEGFLDDNPLVLDGFARHARVVGPLTGHVPDPRSLYLCGLGNPTPKRVVCSRLSAAGANFLTLVHPRAVVGEAVTLGEGSVICPGAVVTCDVEIGRFVTVNLNATIGHDAHIGDFTTLSAHCDVTGGVRLGSGVFLGSRSGVVPGKTVGDGVYVGAGSTVIGDVRAGEKVFGVPARSM